MYNSKNKNNRNPLIESSQLLFLTMGSVIVFSSIVLYFLGNYYIEEPDIVAFIIIIVNILFLFVSFFTLKSFEKIAEISKMKSDFLSAVSHQLRAPVINLKWTLDALVNENSEKKKKDYISNLDENVSRISELIESFLVASEIEEDLSFKKKNVDLKKITEETISRTKIFAEKKGIKIIFNPCSYMPPIFFDESKIKLIIENLITNAIDYSKNEEVIEISTKYQDDKIYFSIKDSGIGIPKEEIDFIFKKFFRAKNSSEKKEKGIGIGLFITKSIIEKAKGEIWFNSKEGEGTTFSFYLPVNSKN